MPPDSPATLTAVLVNYNHAHFLPHSIGSLLSQTRPADELIVIDDASTDDSVAIISRLLKGKPQTRQVQNPKNCGCVATMNRGLELAASDFVFFAAADDEFHPDLFAVAMELLAAHPRAGLFSARSDVIDQDGLNRRLLATPVPPSESGYISPAAVAEQLQRIDSWFMGNTSVYRTAALRHEGGFVAELGPLADGFMARVLALRHGACYTPRSLGSWRRMQSGMAWSQALREDQTQLIDAVAQQIAQRRDLFPPGYFDRWRRRHLFGVICLASTIRSNAASSLWGGGLARRAAHAFRTAWLFVRLRPWDLLPVLRQRLFKSSRRKT